MGYLLKEALKTLCRVNQWCYAVFWKTGCQNPKLLIWEECYYEPAPCSENRLGVPSEDKVRLLVNKMMMDNQVNILGEGLVGRVVFTGNHQWILSENYYREIHPPEILKEVCLQFSAGMQTVAVIPILPHGVVQFGSYLTIAENMGFVNDVVSLIHELGCVPGVMQSENYESNMVNFSPLIGYSTQTPVFDSHVLFPLVGETQNEMQSSPAAFQASKSSSCHLKPHEEAKPAQTMKLDFSFPSPFMNGAAKAQVIPNSVTWMNQHSSQRIPKDLPSGSSSAFSHGTNTKPVLCMDSLLDDNKKASENITSLRATSSGLKNLSLSKMQTSFSDSLLGGTNNRHMNEKIGLSESTQHTEKLNNAELIPGFVEDDKMQKPGDDLFDILGADFKDRWFGSCSRSHLSNESSANIHSWNKNNSPSKNNMASSDSGFFSFTGADHLLDAVVSNTHHSVEQILDDNGSCKTTSNNTGSYSTPKPLLSYGRFEVSDNSKAMSSSSLRPGISKEESETYSIGGSIYDSWIERGHSTSQSHSVATGYSNKPRETSKTNRKRTKSVENPRPRPKDRQMIQDRVKELREIVPNGAKCSIDALLERTIKHMLFMQSVTKHADKLKQTADSKIITKDGGLLLKDDYGGATWAYEVGSQSMICPIIVEDLNLPHQMLVEMLCEGRGLFLEIADIIRGLGLTILKGLMETRNDKIWARFSVEANRSVTRMEIFLSLVRLLEQNSKTGVVHPNSTDDIVVQESV